MLVEFQEKLREFVFGLFVHDMPLTLFEVTGRNERLYIFLVSGQRNCASWLTSIPASAPVRRRFIARSSAALFSCVELRSSSAIFAAVCLNTNSKHNQVLIWSGASELEPT